MFKAEPHPLPTPPVRAEEKFSCDINSNKRDRGIPCVLQLSHRDTPWVNGKVPNGYWDLRENRVGYLKWLGTLNGFFRAEDWYALRKHHFQKNYGGGLLRSNYRSSVQRAVYDLMPDHKWHPWLFGGAPTGFWKQRSNRVEYMNWLGNRLAVREPDDWYRVTGADFFANHGGGLLNNEFKGSVQAVLNDHMPQHPWKAWCFQSVPQCYWASIANRRNYLNWLGQQLGFITREDWNHLRREHFVSHGGAGLFVGYYHGSAQRAREELFADTLAS